MINLQHKIVSDYPTSDGETIRIDVRYKEDTNFAPIVVFSHGFKAYRNWGFIPYICRQLTKAGAIAVNFDFALNGVSSDIEPVYYNSKEFEKNTISHEVHDLNNVIDYVKKLPEVTSRMNGEIHLVGHSRGGMISLLTANKKNTEMDQIHSITLLNSIAKLDRYSEHQKTIWKKEGKYSFTIAKTDQKLGIGYKYIDEIMRAFPTPRLHAILQAIDYPVTIVHAEEDLTVKIEESELLNELIPNSNLLRIPKTGHDFGYTANANKPTTQIMAIIEIIKKTVFG
jgi:uncharacterized protein